MIVTIDPVLLSFGPLAVRWFGLLALVGLGLGVALSLRALPNQRAELLDVLAWSLPLGVLSARATHLLGWWDYYFTQSAQLWQLSLDGLSLWGGLLGGGLIAWRRLGARQMPDHRAQVLDAIVPFVALAIAVGRLGEFLDGHGQGLPTILPWATQYASPLAATPDFGVPRHPAQVYDGLVALGLCLVLSRLPRWLPVGSRAALFLAVYGAARVALGAVRLDPAFLFGLQLEQLLALGGMALGIVALGRLLAGPLLRHSRRSISFGSPPGSSGQRGAEREPGAEEDPVAA